MTALLLFIALEVPIVAAVSLLVIHAMLDAHTEVLAAVLARKAKNLTDALEQAEARLSEEARYRGAGEERARPAPGLDPHLWQIDALQCPDGLRLYCLNSVLAESGIGRDELQHSHALAYRLPGVKPAPPFGQTPQPVHARCGRVGEIGVDVLVALAGIP